MGIGERTSNVPMEGETHLVEEQIFIHILLTFDSSLNSHRLSSLALPLIQKISEGSMSKHIPIHKILTKQFQKFLKFKEN